MKQFNIACIIDDDPVFVFGAQKMMEIVDFARSIVVFNNGQEAIDALVPLLQRKEVDKTPDVIMVDLNMPIMDGWQFIEAFTQNPSEKKVILYIVTSSIDPEDQKRAERYSQVSNYILKPVTLEMLEAILKEHTLPEMP